MSSGSILTSFLGALQASLAVLITIGVGVVASRLNLLKESSAKDVSKTCVRLFLPALLISSIGSELHADTAYRYAPVLIWAILYTVLSMALGWVLKRIFKFPAWTVPAICFNNTTALPLLLIQSLDAAGILADLTMGEGDSSSAALKRAKSYFLVSAMVGNSLTFTIGPKLLDDEESPEDEENKTSQEGEQEQRDTSGRTEEEEDHFQNPTNADGRTAIEEEEYANETTTLLPDFIANSSRKTKDMASEEAGKYWKKLPMPLQTFLGVTGSFVNAPLVGAVIGATLGLVPALHRIFFNTPQDGGFFKAWLTSAIGNVGDLFASLQLVVVGSKLSNSLLRMKRGQASGSVPWAPMLTVFFIRFLMWPALSISVIYLLAVKTSWLDDDPVLWFVLMLMPTGPTATKLTAMADVSGADEDEKMSIAKFITISYAISPFICIAVVGALKASLAIS